jgi:hypothetical protein
MNSTDTDNKDARQRLQHPTGLATTSGGEPLDHWTHWMYAQVYANLSFSLRNQEGYLNPPTTPREHAWPEAS